LFQHRFFFQILIKSSKTQKIRSRYDDEIAQFIMDSGPQGAQAAASELTSQAELTKKAISILTNFQKTIFLKRVLIFLTLI